MNLEMFHQLFRKQIDHCGSSVTLVFLNECSSRLALRVLANTILEEVNEWRAARNGVGGSNHFVRE